MPCVADPDLQPTSGVTTRPVGQNSVEAGSRLFTAAFKADGVFFPDETEPMARQPLQCRLEDCHFHTFPVQGGTRLVLPEGQPGDTSLKSRKTRRYTPWIMGQRWDGMASVVHHDHESSVRTKTGGAIHGPHDDSRECRSSFLYMKSFLAKAPPKQDVWATPSTDTVV